MSDVTAPSYTWVDLLRRVGSGPVECSSCITLARRPRPFVWDTNRYYADLGVPADATRAQLREAYQRLDGQRSARLTYVLKQLLDPDIRARYDATPFGSLFNDEYVQTRVRRQRVQDVADLRRLGRLLEAEELAEMPLPGERGLEDDDDDEPLEVVDTTPAVEEAPPSPRPWSWAYYLDRGPREGDTETLAEWQELLIRVLGQQGHHLHFAVGLSGGMAQPWGVETVGYRLVVFLHESEPPTEANARAAASRAVAHRHDRAAPDRARVAPAWR